MMVLVNLRLGVTAPHSPRKIAAGAQSGAILLAIVEFVITISASVWKIAPPYQPVALLPLIVLSRIVNVPSERMAPPTSLEVLPLIVLRTTLVVVLKKE